MTRIGKGLFKVISICVSVCLFVHTIACAAPNLRANLMFDEINERQDKKRLNYAVASKNDIKKQMQDIFEELRPDFKGKKELTVYEFEDHIRLKAGELGAKYKHVKTNAWNTIIINLRAAIRETIGYIFIRGENRLPSGLLGLPFFTVVSFATASFKDNYDLLKKIKVVTPGFFSFVTPLIVVISVVILEIFGVNVLPISSDYPDFYYLILTFVLSFPATGIMLNLKYYSEREEVFLHELAHLYLYLFEYRLIKEGIIKEPISLGEGPDKEGVAEILFKKTINRANIMLLEESVLIDILAELKDEVKQATLASNPNVGGGELIHQVHTDSPYKTYVVADQLYLLLNKYKGGIAISKEELIEDWDRYNRITSSLNKAIKLGLPGASELLELYKKGGVIFFKASSILDPISDLDPRLVSKSMTRKNVDLGSKFWDNPERELIERFLWHERIHLRMASLDKESRWSIDRGITFADSGIVKDMRQKFPRGIAGDETIANFPLFLSKEEVKKILNSIYDTELTKVILDIYEDTRPTKEEVIELHNTAQAVAPFINEFNYAAILKDMTGVRGAFNRTFRKGKMREILNSI